MSWSGRSVVPFVVLALIAYFLFRIHEVLLPFVLSGAVAYLLGPAVRFFEVQGFRREPVVLMLFLVLTSLFTLVAYKLAWVAAFEAGQAAHNMPHYVQKGGEIFARLRGSMNSSLFEYIAEHGKDWPQDILSRMPSFALGVFPVLEVVILVPFISFFFIREAPVWRDKIVAWVPSSYVEMTLNLFFELDNSLGRYVRGIMMEAFCVGVLAYIGFWMIDLNYALQIAMIVGLANVVPYVGPVVGILLGGAVALFQGTGAVGVLSVIAVCAAVRFIEDWFIQPLVLTKAVHLHPVMVVLALMAGAELFGFWGLLFAVPVACMVKVLLEVLWPWYRLQYGYPTAPPLSEVNRIPLV